MESAKTTAKEDSPLLDGQQPLRRRLYQELGAASLIAVSVLTLSSFALNVSVLTPKVIFLTVDFLPSISALPSKSLQEQVGTWMGPYTVFHTIDMLAKKRMWILVVILVFWSIIFPFVKCVSLSRVA